MTHWKNTYTDLGPEFFHWTYPKIFHRPEFLVFNTPLAESLGYGDFQRDIITFLSQENSHGPNPIFHSYSTVYAAHQFGHFVPQLGDGRAIFLGEYQPLHGLLKDIQLKGAGPTPYSRRGDGFSALGPVVREYCISEWMHGFGISSTRSLGIVSTGEKVFRETALPGGILIRVADGHVRVGTFQYFFNKLIQEGWTPQHPKGNFHSLQKLFHYSINRFYPELLGMERIHTRFLEALIQRQVKLIAQWMSVGFIHGVMNTDNMSISGETLDFGPCAFMDQFNSAQCFSFIDRNGRYAYDQQPVILQWNMLRMAETLIPLCMGDSQRNFEEVQTEFNEVISSIPKKFQSEWGKIMAQKIGFSSNASQTYDEEKIFFMIQKLLRIFELHHIDFTLGFLILENELVNFSSPLWDRMNEHVKIPLEFKVWIEEWRQALLESVKGEEFPKEILQNMNQVNPLFIPRNHMMEKMIQEIVSQSEERPNSHLNDQHFSELKKFLELQKRSRSRNDLNEYHAHHPSVDNWFFPPSDNQKISNTFCGT